jgi:Plasmid pRiA4b ORF-3-like protein
MKKKKYLFRIELIGIEPTIWRLIEVPENYSFWDLHVAIQDSMGWFDYHLHVFCFKSSNPKKPIEIGIPDKDFDDGMIAGWQVPLRQYFREPGDEANYEYDFGDSWNHRVVLERVSVNKEETKLPHCMDGKGACPPEDCGGVHGYYYLLKVIEDPGNEEYDNTVYWLSNHVKNYHPFKPEYFKPSDIKFWDPQKRWKIAFEDDEGVQLN